VLSSSGTVPLQKVKAQAINATTIVSRRSVPRAPTDYHTVRRGEWCWITVESRRWERVACSQSWRTD